jgi:hypothetical protein
MVSTGSFLRVVRLPEGLAPRRGKASLLTNIQRTSSIPAKAYGVTRLKDKVSRLTHPGRIAVWVRMRRTMQKLFPDPSLERSIIVCAHPDDEVLWFSSILCQVDSVLVCFLDKESRPDWSAGRRQALSMYPLHNIQCLGISQTDIFMQADWSTPEVAEYGIPTRNGDDTAKKYMANFEIIKNKLRDKLIGYQNVFTHNPWGEYGHEEHVQIYRIVRELQSELGFDLWFSNYCSNLSIGYMMRMLPLCDTMYVSRKTDTVVYKRIKYLYKINRCWTWADDWKCFQEESFIKGRIDESRKISNHVFPLNLVHIDE